MAQSRAPGGHYSRGFLTEEEKANRPEITAGLLKRILSGFRPYTGRLAAVLFCIAAGAFLSLLPSILTGKIIDEGLMKQDLPVLVKYIGLSLGATVSANLIGIAESYNSTWIAQPITRDFRNRMYAHLQQMSHRFFTENGQGDIITRMTSDIDGVERVISSTFTSILSNVITLLIAFTAMFRKSWILAVAGIFMAVFFTLPTRRAGKTRWKYANESQAYNDRINNILSETLSVSGQLLCKLFGNEAYEYGRYADANEHMIRLNIRESLAGRWFRLVLRTLTSIGPLMIYLAGGILMIRHGADLTIGDISVMVTLLGKMYTPVNGLLSIQAEWIRSMAMFTRIFNYFDIPVEIKNAPDAVIPDSAEGNITFEHVSFHYDENRTVLRDVNFTLKAGHSIAIVGPSGAGKTTIINLIPRLYDVTGGRVTFDGVDLRKLDLSFLRSQIGMVSQDTYLFNGTIRENLLYARHGAGEAEMEDALRKANILDFVKKQPEGLDVVVGNRGLKLSGGEKQRISIARVLLKDPKIFIFDEATSSLDSMSEKEIQKAIEPIIRSRTSILIAHRLSTIMSADEILVVKDGTIAERGTHSELLQRNGIYTELYNSQFLKEGR